MNRILIIGCGDIAMRVVPLLGRRQRIFALVRNPTYCAKLRTLSVTPILGDLDDRLSLERIAGIADVVLNFAPPPNQGEHDTRTSNLLAALSQRTLPGRLVYISTSGVYGDCGGSRVRETHPTNPQTARACRRVDAEKQIRNWAKRSGVRAIILRVPGIYAANRLPLDRLRMGAPTIVNQEDSYTNHIHADDLAHTVVKALRNGRPNRIYHVCDDSEIKMGDYLDLVADAFRLARPTRLSRAEVERSVSSMLWSFMNESRRLCNERMKLELRVRLRYPKVAVTLASIKD
jgi:nucleoside-diphosphate-sugar epimerase